MHVDGNRERPTDKRKERDSLQKPREIDRDEQTFRSIPDIDRFLDK